MWKGAVGNRTVNPAISHSHPVNQQQSENMSPRAMLNAPLWC